VQIFLHLRFFRMPLGRINTYLSGGFGCVVVKIIIYLRIKKTDVRCALLYLLGVPRHTSYRWIVRAFALIKRSKTKFSLGPLRIIFFIFARGEYPPVVGYFREVCSEFQLWPAGRYTPPAQKWPFGPFSQWLYVSKIGASKCTFLRAIYVVASVDASKKLRAKNALCGYLSYKMKTSYRV